ICMLITLGTRFGVYRLLLQNTAVGTYDLVVKQGVNFMQPLLGSDQVSMEVSDKLFEVSPKGRAPFTGGSSIFFPAFNRQALLRWLNNYYLEELRQAPNTKAPNSVFFIQQIPAEKSSSSELIELLRTGASAA